MKIGDPKEAKKENEKNHSHEEKADLELCLNRLIDDSCSVVEVTGQMGVTAVMWDDE